MRSAGMIALLSCLAWTSAGFAEDKEKPEDAIRKVLDDQEKAWNKGDLEGYMAGYWKSDKLTFSGGTEETQGWDATLERYRKKYKGKDVEMGKVSFPNTRIEMLGDAHAVVRGTWELTFSKDKKKGLFTLIMKKFPEGWRIVHDHSS